MLVALIAVLPLAIWACEDAGDGPDGPTGPSTQYNPEMDYPGASISAYAADSTVGPGETIRISATIKDANGAPIEGMPLAISAEAGGAKGYFDYQTNPTLTDANGSASIRVLVSAGCPEDSYTFVIVPVGGPAARGYVHVVVSGTGGGGSEAITSVRLETSTPTISRATTPDANFTATPTGTAVCDERYLYQATGAGLATSWIAYGLCDGFPSCNFPVTTTNTGTLTVQVSAYCNETGVGAVSSTANVTVNP